MCPSYLSLHSIWWLDLGEKDEVLAILSHASFQCLWRKIAFECLELQIALILVQGSGVFSLLGFSCSLFIIDSTPHYFTCGYPLDTQMLHVDGGKRLKKMKDDGGQLHHN